MLQEGIIRPSNSLCRTQVLITAGNNHKKRMVVDYSRTINRCTELYTYPLPRIDDMANNMARDEFSELELKSGYHQVPIREGGKLYTAFEADAKLYELNRISTHSIPSDHCCAFPSNVHLMNALCNILEGPYRPRHCLLGSFIKARPSSDI